MANKISYNLKPAPGIDDRPAVYRMNFGKRYFIWKCKNIHQSLKTISKDLGRKTETLPSEEDLFFCMAAYMKRFRVFHFTAEIILQTNDHDELIECEHKLLMQCQGDPDCCNSVFVPHIPAWITPSQPKSPAPAKTTSNKAPQAIKLPEDDKIPQKDIKVQQMSEKPAPVENKAPTSTADIQMPDIDIDDISGLLDSFLAGQK